MQKILIGCDPEVFITFGPDKSELVSAIGMIGGSKDNPRQIRDGTLQEDNVLAELGIIPAATEDEFVSRVSSVLGQLREHLHSMSTDLDFAIMASAIMPDHALEDPRALVFGCDPDYNAWTGEVNPKPSSATNLRTAGGHIHIGYEVESGPKREDVIKACDLFIGIPAVLLDGDKERMKMYGKAGAFRPKPYGVEYRTPSNFWLKDESIMRFVYRQAHRAVAAATDTQFMEILNANERRLTAAISDADGASARIIADEFGISVGF